MSTLTTLYDKIRSTIPTLTGFSTKTEIANPYSLEDNNATFLRDGWGIILGSSTPETSTEFHEYTILSEFGVVVTRSFTTTASNPDPLVTATKELLADISAVENDFTGRSRFTIADKVESVGVLARSAMTNLVAGKFNHITTTITFGFTHWK